PGLVFPLRLAPSIEALDPTEIAGEERDIAQLVDDHEQAIGNFLACALRLGCAGKTIFDFAENLNAARKIAEAPRLTAKLGQERADIEHLLVLRAASEDGDQTLGLVEDRQRMIEMRAADERRFVELIVGNSRREEVPNEIPAVDHRHITRMKRVKSACVV